MSEIVPTLNHVIGQKRAVNVLRNALDAYFNERAKSGKVAAFPHTLICGPAGAGKTFLSELVAQELCTTLHTELAQNLRSPKQVHGLLMLLNGGDILFIDEIQDLTNASQVALYRALEERKLFLGGNRTPITLPPFCLIGATTHEYQLTSSSRQRFRILLRLNHYSESEMSTLLHQRAKRLKWSISEEAICRLASLSRGVARLGIGQLENAKRVASAQADDAVTIEHVQRMYDLQGLDSLGFDPVEQSYLKLLGESQEAVRLNVIASVLQLPKQTIEMFESDFLRLRLITKSDAGRMLAEKGIAHLAASSAKEPQ